MARRSLKRRKSQAPSDPGSPPRSRTGLLKQIYYAFDPGSRSVVVGPVKLSGIDGSVPRLLEEGGTAQRRFRLLRDDQGEVIRIIYDENAPTQTVRYAPRPYMAPALASAAARTDQFWRDAVRN